MTGPATPAPQQASMYQLLIDLGPVALFVLVYNVLMRRPDMEANAVFIATGVFIGATLLAMLVSWLRIGKIPPVLFVTGIIVTAFGGLTIALHDETFVKLKPTFANFFYAVAIAGSVVAKQNVWKLMFGHVFVLPERIWNILALRWAAFFFVLGIVNEVLRRTLDTAGWVTWHFPVLYGATLLFAFANAPLVFKHAPKEDGGAQT